MPHLPYPQVYQSQQEASVSHYALGPPQYHPQDQNDPPFVPPHLRPSEAPKPVKTKENRKRKAPDSEEAVPDKSAPKNSADKKSKKTKVSSPPSKAQPLPKRKPGRPSKAELARRALEEQKAANAQSNTSTSHGSSPQEPSTGAAPKQEPREPVPPQTGILGNPQASATSHGPTTSAEAPAAHARENERSTAPLWTTNLPAAFYDFIGRYPPLNPNQNDTDPISALIPSAWLDLNNFPPIDDSSWPSVNSLTLPSLARRTYEKFEDVVDDPALEGFPWTQAPRRGD
ncbi:hypothetical protein IW261DRAFT_1468458 [Armillaria novae-zelandiae]|uniref:Uncharacterized protein n=1 Tax=Armillaria novae-zelandiae TaxID=153914 RepID=A0AA39PE80_9AGAR|nr:hypothetical protein IW261DRAFT_1468458 [Armillaria novae-zelandiae]